METNNNLFNPFLLFFLAFVLLVQNAESQVKNQAINSEFSSKYGVRLSLAKQVPVYQLPGINVKTLLSEDSLEALQGKPFRFGKAVEVDIDLVNSSSISRNSDTTIYFYKILSKNAFSINLIFDKFSLATNATLFIYNTNETMIYGPVTSQNNPKNGVFWTGLIRGESIIIQLIISGEDTKETKLHLDKVVHGYQNVLRVLGNPQAATEILLVQRVTHGETKGIQLLCYC